MHENVTEETFAAEVELKAIRDQVAQARELLGDAVKRLANNFTGLDQEANSQRAALQEVLAALSSPTAGNNGRVSVAAFATETSEVLRQFAELLATVSKQSVRTVYRIDDMAAQLDQVFRLVTSINEIAEETFILAVNATIEAAHAGNSGRSFSVIAGNVRELSKKTRRFNEEIGTQIAKARSAVDDVRSIISEMASRDLSTALSGKARVQSMLESMESFEQLVRDALECTDAAAERISEVTGEGVAALQFEDVMTKLLASTERRAERASRLLGPGAANEELFPS